MQKGWLMVKTEVLQEPGDRLLGCLAASGGCQAGHLLVNLEHVVAHSLGKRTALADHHLITGARIEGGRAVSGDHLVTLLVTTVLLLVVKVVATDGDGVLHEGTVHGATKKLAADGDLTHEWALLVDVATALGLLRHLEAQTDGLDLAWALAGAAGQQAS